VTIDGMTDVTIGLLHPGEMGAAVGQCLAAAGHQVLWTDQGRSPATRERAEAAGLKAAGIEDIAALF
jgi:3-hydroxyisobutyrate dehydrogenase-like beta-hydroxyacid dehydrogenase